MAARAELSSLASTLTDLTRRVSGLAEQARDEGDSEVATELFTVERALNGALRRLERTAAGGGGHR